MTEKKKDSKAERSTEAVPERRRLLRSRRERVLWGVAGGLADYLRVDPTWVRLGFVAAIFFGGFGALAYLVMAVVVPEDDGSGNPVLERRPPTWALILLGAALLFMLPGPFWGWGEHDWWWGLAGPFWLALLIGAGVIANRAISGRPLGLSRAGRKTGGARTESSVGPSGDPPRLAGVLALIALGLLAICCAACLAAVSAWAAGTGNGAPVAGVVIALGIALAVSAFVNEARRAAPWLLVLALVLALPAGAIAAADVRFEGGIGEREHSPVAVAEIPDDGYQHGIGQLTVDLRELPWREGEVVPLRAQLGIGQLIVAVPEEVCVTGEGEAKAGELLVRGESNSGVDPAFDRGTPSGSAPRLELDGELQFGQLVVTDEDPDEVEHRDRGGDDDEQAARNDEACGR